MCDPQLAESHVELMEAKRGREEAIINETKARGRMEYLEKEKEKLDALVHCTLGLFCVCACLVNRVLCGYQCQCRCRYLWACLVRQLFFCV